MLEEWPLVTWSLWGGPLGRRRTFHLQRCSEHGPQTRLRPGAGEPGAPPLPLTSARFDRFEVMQRALRNERARVSQCPSPWLRLRLLRLIRLRLRPLRRSRPAPEMPELRRGTGINGEAESFLRGRRSSRRLRGRGLPRRPEALLGLALLGCGNCGSRKEKVRKAVSSGPLMAVCSRTA